MKNYKLTKTLIMSGLQCHKKLWFDVHKKIKKEKATFKRGDLFGEQVVKKYKKGYYNSSKAGRVHYDSSWEVRRMKEFDFDKTIKTWNRCSDKILWHDINNKSHYYNPDFYIEYNDGRIIVEEVKGWKNENALLKIEAGQKYYKNKNIEYRVIDELSQFNEPIEIYCSEYENSYGIFERPNFEYIWMMSAVLLSKRSTCLRGKVGCVITDKDMNRVLCLGYNGDSPGGDNQCESLESGKCGCIHAEINAITKASESLNGCVAFITLAPCYHCAKILFARGITKVIYKNAYRR